MRLDWRRRRSWRVFRTAAVAALLFLAGSVILPAYFEDIQTETTAAHSTFHYELMRTLARAAGFTSDESELIAVAGAATDSATFKGEWVGSPSLVITGTDRLDETLSRYWHYARRGTQNSSGGYTYPGGRNTCTYFVGTADECPSGQPEINTIEQWAVYGVGTPALGAPTVAQNGAAAVPVPPGGLVALGMYVHALADSFSHERCMDLTKDRTHAQIPRECRTAYWHLVAEYGLGEGTPWTVEGATAAWKALNWYRSINDLTQPAPWDDATATAFIGGWVTKGQAADRRGTAVTAYSSLTPSQGVQADFNGDGQGDAFIYNAATGVWSMQLRNATTGLFETTPGGWSPQWTLRSGDFNGDRKTDLFVYNTTTGVWYEALSTGSDFSYTEGRWSPGWDITVLDLNGDGRSDLFVYDPATGTWFKCVRTTSNTAAFQYYAGQWSPGWQVIPVELNGDGRADLFVYSTTSGQWFRVLNDTNATFAYVSGNWTGGLTIVPGDFNGDMKSDLFAYDAASGAWTLYINSDSAFSATSGTWSPGWTLRVGDFNADGLHDLFVYDAGSGTWFVCLNNGANGFAYPSSGTWSPGWQIQVADLNADRRSDLLVYNSSTGGYYQCLYLPAGVFDYKAGSSAANATVVASRPGLP